MIDPDFELGHAGDLRGLDVFRSLDARRDFRRLLGEPFQHIEIVAENLDRDIALDAGYQLVDPQGDRLGKGVAQPDDLLQFGADDIRHLFLSAELLPLLRLFERDEDVALLGAHGVFGNLRPAGLADDGGDFGELHQPLLDFRRNLHRPLERRVRQANRIDRESAFLERRHEISADHRSQEAGPHENHHRQQHRESRQAHRQVEQLPVEPVNSPGDEKLVLLAVGKAVHAERRHDEQSHDQGGQQRDQHRQGQRPEHLRFQPLQREQRHQHQDDYEHRKGDRPSHFGDGP
ncbi:MAG: hypothetical protein BWY66_02514 [bacterium ADurb.Bin374]|nr:MAG: hypothetical protein BWY66_02514 [bacterium ADurb.Bin374]